MKYVIYAAFIVIVLISNTEHVKITPSTLPIYPNTINVLFVDKNSFNDPIPANAPYVVLDGNADLGTQHQALRVLAALYEQRL